MAEVTAFRNNALPYPVYGMPWVLVFPWRDADGDLIDTSAGTPDCERSLNGDTVADCTNEAVLISGSVGLNYLILTAAEMTCDVLSITAKSGTAGAKTPVAILSPRKLPILKASATVEGGAAGSITLDVATAVAIDDYYNGALIVATIDSVVEYRICTDYVASTRVCTVVPNWVQASPDSDDTAVIYDTDLRQFKHADLVGWKSVLAATVNTAGYPVVTIKDGTGAGEIDTTSGGVLVAAIAANAITATAINADAFTAAKFAADVTTEFQSGLATASALATVSAFIDTEVASILAAVDTEVAAILVDTNELQTDWVNGGRLDLLIDGIKAKTDSLTFTVANTVNSNITYVNEIEVTGDGEIGTEWNPV